MGFEISLSRFFDSRKGEDDKRSDEESRPKKPRSFMHLDNLIHRGEKEILLDADIVLDEYEQSDYIEGIGLDVDDIVIDARGHSIDACGKVRIFNCTGKNIEIRNMDLKNGYAEGHGGAILNSGDLTIRSSSIASSKADNNGGAIFNKGKMIIEDTYIIENKAVRSGGAILNSDGDMDISHSEFRFNIAEEWGGAIYNSGELNISDSILNENISHYRGGAIFNYVNGLRIVNSIISSNNAVGAGSFTTGGGAIFNYRGDLTIEGSTLEDNMAIAYSDKNTGGGAVSNSGKLSIMGCELKDNQSIYGGGAVSNGGELNISDSKFIGNNGHGNGGAILCTDKEKVKLDNCTFENNDGEDLYEDSDNLWKSFI